ncbi:hypothetical protein RHGRI_023662 [Rhododendron griersonianum]|uniref:Uncharacterized protein n=1 Tax=Rhododendron griersonianum TaxID=479676 RepID=A0AAV6J9T5_9ERIC|nr:hypothetical protein RHGRI_023662 [Rhododendron griersonianum]
MTTLLLRRSTSLKEMRDLLLVHRIPAVLQSKRRREKSFARLGTELGAVYYLRSSNDTITIPEEFVPYIFAPPDAVVIIHSGARFFHVKLKNDELTVGWDRVALTHNLGRNYILMFGLVRHLQFDLFVFDEEGCEVSYDWSTTLPIHQTNAPIGWDAELAMSNANGCKHAFTIAFVISSNSK